MGINYEMPNASPQEAPQNKEKILSPTLQEIKDAPLTYDDAAYEEAARRDPISRETSTEAFVRLARVVIDGVPPGPNTFGAMLRILERDSMKGHPNMEIFKKTVQELAEKTDQKLSLPEDYWDRLE